MTKFLILSRFKCDVIKIKNNFQQKIVTDSKEERKRKSSQKWPLATR